MANFITCFDPFTDLAIQLPIRDTDEAAAMHANNVPQLTPPKKTADGARKVQIS